MVIPNWTLRYKQYLIKQDRPGCSASPEEFPTVVQGSFKMTLSWAGAGVTVKPVWSSYFSSYQVSASLTWLILPSVSDVPSPLANVTFEEGGKLIPLLGVEGHSVLPPSLSPVQTS